MAVINIANVGGIRPSISKRALPNDSAQKANNLLARTVEFRPLGQDMLVASSPIPDPRTLHRLARKLDGTFNGDMTTGWLTSARVISYAKGPLNDDLTERGYFTYDDGLTPPGTIDTSAIERPLGVPAPLTQPTGDINRVYEFTPEIRSTQLLAAQKGAHDAFVKNSAIAWVGADHPGTARPGYIDRYGMTADTPDGAQVLRVFRTSSVGGANNGVITNTYSALPVNQAGWIFDPALGGFWATANAGHPAWTGNVNDHYCIPLNVYGRTNTLTNAAGPALAALTLPGSVTTAVPAGTPLFSLDQTTQIVNEIQALISPTGTRVGPAIAALKAKAVDVSQLIDVGAQAAVATTVTQFYATTAAPVIAAAVDVLAEAIWRKALEIATAPSPFVPNNYSSGNDR